MWPKSDLDVSDDVAVISLVSLKILPMLLAHPSQMLVLLEQVSLVSVLGQVPIYQNGLLQSCCVQLRGS